MVSIGCQVTKGIILGSEKDIFLQYAIVFGGHIDKSEDQVIVKFDISPSQLRIKSVIIIFIFLFT
jgi:hypothetical protein